MRINNRVEELLLRHPSTRNSDKELLLKIWEEEGLYLSPDQKQTFYNCSTAESITRARRKLKQQYPASAEVDEGRYQLFQEYRNWYRG